MKNFQRLFFLLAIVFSSSANAQDWKRFEDSAKVYEMQGNYKKSLEFYMKVKEDLMKDSLNTQTYAGSYIQIGDQYWRMTEYEKALTLYLESKKITEKVLGKGNPDYGSVCTSIGMLYQKIGKYHNSEPYLLEALLTREKIYGKESRSYSFSSSQMGLLYYDMGLFEKAEAFMLEAKQIRERVYGKESFWYGASCSNLGLLYYSMREFNNAELLSLEALDITLIVEGRESANYAGQLSNVGELYRAMGNYDKAEAFFKQSKEIFEKVVGNGDPYYAMSCENLGLVYLDKMEYGKAEPFLLEAKQIREKVFGKEHPDYASICTNLSDLYISLKDFKKAENYLLEARQIYMAAVGKDHPNYATSCNELGYVYFLMENYIKAEPLLLEALQIRKKILGNESPDYSETCRGLGDLYLPLKNTIKTRTFYEEAYHAQQSQITNVFQFISEAEKQSFFKKNSLLNKSIYSFNTFWDSKTGQAFSYDVALSSRNVVLSSSQQLIAAINLSKDTIVQNKYNQWKELKEQIAFWFGKPSEQIPEYLKDLHEKANFIEKELTRLSTEFRKQQKKEISRMNILQELKANEAVIEFVEFQYYNGRRLTDSNYYIALVLRKDKPEGELVKLFEKRELDSLLSYKNTSAGQHQLSFLYTKPNNIKDGKSKSLYDIIWQPLEKELNGIKTVYFAPAGSLHKIAFAALPVSNKEVLNDKYNLIQLYTTASVGDKSGTRIAVPDKIILYGGVQYDADSTSIRQAAVKYSANDVTTRSLPDDLLRDGVAEFYYLPETEKEVNAISKLAGQNNYAIILSEGLQATEESFKSLNGKNSTAVLHIATHGFFFPDPKSSNNDDKAGGAAVFKQSDNPLIRSGLALAGANNVWKGKPVAGVEDGILTSYEVSNMYFPNTKLVVLSACETGLGDIQGSEGVYGLQRAFKMAGVENLVMSLWKVDDMATSEFMQEFYKNLFAKQTIQEAFYNAQTVMKNKYRNDPYKWAAWVLVR